MDSIIRCKHIFIMYVSHAVIRRKGAALEERFCLRTAKAGL